jgi:transposase
MGRSRGGLTTKLHALVDGRGRPVALALTAGQVHDSKVALGLMDGLVPGQTFMANKAYDADAILARCRAAGARANTPPKSYRKHPQPFDKALYRRRNVVERFFNRIKQYRGLATRYDELAETFIAGITLAAIRIAIKTNESTA